jgi:hypothetical protein
MPLLERILLAIEAEYEQLSIVQSSQPIELISLAQLDSVAAQSFPLCMRLLLYRLQV